MPLSSKDRNERWRVVVTGVGVKTPAGNERAEFWATVCAGRSVIAPIRSFDPTSLEVRFGGEVRDFDPAAYLGAKIVRQTDRVTHLAVGAAFDALDEAAPGPTDPDRCAIVVGTGIGSVTNFYNHTRAYVEGGPASMSPRAVPMIMSNASAAWLAIRLGWHGPSFCVATACASSANAIGEAARLIRDGSADVALAGGSEAALHPLIITGFARMGALSTRNERPEGASRPFDADRDGFVLSEGAGFVVLESLYRAARRDAPIYGEIAGYGHNCDGHHIAMPDRSGFFAATCMRLALADAGLAPGEIAHINAHGTSTLLNDATEARAIRAVFGTRPPPVTSTKGVIGHLVGACGAVEAVASLLAMRQHTVPPTANLHVRDPDIDLDVVAGEPRSGCSGPVLSNSFGFGGHNSTLVLAPPPYGLNPTA
jgi:3-oxoacyl-[acyl-carrier-protein] synthase II